MKRYEFEMIIKKGDETIYYKKNLSQLAVDVLIGIENTLNMVLRDNRHLLFDFLLRGSTLITPDPDEKRKHRIPSTLRQYRDRM